MLDSLVLWISAAFESPFTLSAAMALFGGCVYLRQCGAPLSVRLLIGQMMSSVFVGGVVYLLLYKRFINDIEALQGLSGAAGYIGVKLLDSLGDVITQAIKTRNGGSNP